LQQEKNALDALQTTSIESRNRLQLKFDQQASQIAQLQEAVNLASVQIDRQQSEKIAIEDHVNNHESKKRQLQRNMEQDSSRRQELLQEVQSKPLILS